MSKKLIILLTSNFKDLVINSMKNNELSIYGSSYTKYRVGRQKVKSQ